MPIFGKFSDMIGRKPVMLFGIGAFVLGSVLCGIAWSMPALIAFRAIQGLGAGAVQPTAMTIVGDLYSVAERAKVQGYVASVWAVSSVVGPTLGGVFSDFLSWRWIFFVNVPLGGLAAVMLMRGFPEKVDQVQAQDRLRGRHLADGRQLAADPRPARGRRALGLGLGPEHRHPGRRRRCCWSPSRWSSGGPPSRSCRAGCSVAGCWPAPASPRLAVGVMLIGLTSYVPLFVQGVLGTGALVAGFALAALTLGWPIAASVAGRIYLRIGFRNTALIGSAIVVVGAFLMTQLSSDSSVWQVGATCFVVGLGMGLVASPTLIAAQSAVDGRDRGVVTGTNMFARSMGSALGVAVFGAIANAALGRQGRRTRLDHGQRHLPDPARPGHARGVRRRRGRRRGADRRCGADAPQVRGGLSRTLACCAQSGCLAQPD